MNIVEITNGEIVTTIHGSEVKLLSGTVTKGINTIDSFTFSMLPDNPGFSLVNEFTTHVTVYNTQKGRYDFMGRVLYAETTMDESGLIVKTVTCENLFGYLCDSVQEYVEPQNWTVRGLLAYIISWHNLQVEEYKWFQIGNITQTEANDNIYIGIQRDNTWDTIKSKLIDQIGGEIQFRYEEDGIFIDYLEQIGTVKDTEIALSVNMKSITREQDPTAYVTRLIPLGCKLTDEEGKETEQRLDISSVTDGGVKYIEDELAVSLYGIHVKVVEWDDITNPTYLMLRGKQWMNETNRVNVKYTVTALDLSLLGLAVDDFDIGNVHPIRNELIGIDDTARIIKVSLNVCEEIKSSFDVGDNIKTMSDIQREQTEQIKAASQNVQSMQTSTSARITAVNENLSQEMVLLQESMTEQYTTAVNAFDSILFEALKTYVQTNQYEEFKSTLKTELEVWANGITGSVTATESSIKEVNDELQEKYNTITKYFTFDINGMTIGSVDNPNKIIIDNDEITIYANGVPVQEFKADGSALIPILKITQAVTALGLHVSEDDTHINCDYIWG